MKRYKKIIKIRKEIKISIIILLIIFIVFTLTDIVKRIDDSFIESCTKAGYTLQHCERVK